MIHLEDDFFEDPYSIRSIALKSKYYSAEDYTWPGWRCWSIPEIVTNNILFKVRSIVGDPNLNFDYSRTQIPGYPNSSFQYITKEFGDGVYHSDEGLHYICIIYLSLESSLDSGTEICDYDHGSDTFPRLMTTKLKQSFLRDPYNLIKRYRYARIRRKLNSYYNPLMKVPNKFNRGVIFPATYFHRAQNYFGTSIESARLTSVSFLG